MPINICHDINYALPDLTSEIEAQAIARLESTYKGGFDEDGLLKNSLNIICTRDLENHPETIARALLMTHWSMDRSNIASPVLLSQATIQTPTTNHDSNRESTSVARSTDFDNLILAFSSSRQAGFQESRLRVRNTESKLVVETQNVKLFKERILATIRNESDNHLVNRCSAADNRTTCSKHAEGENRISIEHLAQLLRTQTPFAFNRISDGELAVLSNKTIRLGLNGASGWQVGDKMSEGGAYPMEERKSFYPARDWELRKHLIMAMKYSEKNYILGLTLPCCIQQHGVSSSEWLLQQRLLNKSNTNPVDANLLINYNYITFLKDIVPLFRDYVVVCAVNKRAIFDALPFDVTRVIKVGDDCITSWKLLLSDTLSAVSYAKLSNKGRPILFLASCATVAKVLVHQVYSRFKDVTCIDIGSSLNPLLELDGWRFSRGYLQEYWLFRTSLYTRMRCGF